MIPPITGVFSNSAYFPNNKMGAFFLFVFFVWLLLLECFLVMLFHFRALQMPFAEAQKGCGDFTLDMVISVCLVGSH